MKRKNSLPFSLVSASLVCFFVACASVPFLVPNPPQSRKKPETVLQEPAPPPEKPLVKPEVKPEIVPERKPDTGQQTPDSIDFAIALEPGEDSSAGYETNAPGPAGRGIAVRCNRIRVALRQGVKQAALYAMGDVSIRSASFGNDVVCRGRIAMEVRDSGHISLAADSSTFEAALPCTLAAQSGYALISLDQENFHGALIVAGGKNVSIINDIDIEEYLHGVLPLEIGRRSSDEFEALKAQAIAARTYGYRRMQEHSADLFDVQKSVADQVYRGADPETPEASRAVDETAGLVLVYGDSLIRAYYHSTCGGRTANVRDVWEKPPCGYLCSIGDTAPDGRAFCAWSPFFEWEESWRSERLSKIIHGAVPRTYRGRRFSGSLRSIEVARRFECGRVAECRVSGTRDTLVCGGDKVRSVFRRKGPSGDILRSAAFTIVKNGPDEFVLRGRGYGHGVGLCQTGAVGRARAGQNCEEILRAYFQGTEIRKVRLGG